MLNSSMTTYPQGVCGFRSPYPYPYPSVPLPATCCGCLNPCPSLHAFHASRTSVLLVFRTSAGVESQRHMQRAEGWTQRGPQLDWDGQGLVRTAWNGPRVDKGVHSTVRERTQGMEGVQRPEMNTCTKIHGVSASLWGQQVIG